MTGTKGQVFEDIRQMQEQWNAQDACNEYALALAYGVGVEDPDPDDAGIIVTVYQGQLYSLAISDSYTDVSQIPLENVATLLNGAFQVAYEDWENDLKRLRALALEAIAGEDPETAVAMLSEAVSVGNPLTGTDPR